MARVGKLQSLSLTGLFLLSIVLTVTMPATNAAASNETTSGTITGTETWAGLHELTGDVTIAPGAKLIINPGATIVFPNGTHLDVRGSICAGASSCGASSNGGPAMRITLRWEDPANSSAIGECYGMTYGNQEISIDDPSCNEGVLMRSSIDLAETELRYVTFDSAWGIPQYITAVGEFRYGALVLDGASPTLTELAFSQINTTSVLTTNLAQPTFSGGDFAVGVDAQSGVYGSALQIYSSGSSINPFVLSDVSLTGTDNGCGQRDGGRATIWAQDSFIEIDNAEIVSGDYGIALFTSAGKVTNTVINVNCNGIDVNSKKAVGSTSFEVDISDNEITTSEGAGITAYAGALVTAYNNDIEGASGGSGISVLSSEVHIHENEIGPINGYFGLWLGGSYDVIAENNSIFQTSLTPVVAGRYGSQAIREPSRLFLANNTISYDGTGTCNDNTNWDGQFPCPVIHAYVTGVTMYDNIITATGNADGIRAIGSLLDIQRNNFDIENTGAIIKNYDSGAAESEQYGSLGYFAENDWNDATSVYNVTKSSVTAQSEHIPSPPSGEYPVKLSWPDQEAWPDNFFQGSIIPTPVKSCANCQNMTPRNFPLGVSMDNNSTVFTFADLTNLDLSNIQIATQPTHYAVQVSRAELVRFQSLIDGEKVTDALVVVEDALGNDLYRINSGSDGYTPWVALPSNFHLDFRGLGGGNNPDGFADDEYEDSCSDGIDNDGDLSIDTDDPSCDYNAGTRELSMYRYTSYKFGFGYYSGEFTLEDTSLEVTANMENQAPTVVVTEENGQSFRRVVNITGSAHDGQLANSYQTDELAQWDQGGYVHAIQVKDPFTGSWEDAEFAIDTSGVSEGEVSRFNRPFSSWYYNLDMTGLAGEGDYTFEFRAFDGLEYSQVVSRTIKLNTQPPTIFVTTPSSFSPHDNGEVYFEGYAQDPYGCPSDCNSDVGEVYVKIEGPNYEVTTSIGYGPGDMFSWTWDFSSRPYELATYNFTIWASDSDFCVGIIDECQPVVLILSVDNRNSQPTISINEPYSGTRISTSSETPINGVARDFDGTVTRIDLQVKDVSNDFIIIDEASTTEISSLGEWEILWDTNNLRHDAEYLLRIRSYDGIDYSEWSDVSIIADNPPNAGNNQPQFDGSEWQEEIILYCDSDSNSVDKCTSAEIDLNSFFSDLDGDIQYISVYNDTSIDTDDMFPLWVEVGPDGVARYDPYLMQFYDDDVLTWTLENVIFIATDKWESRINSNPVTFRVVPLQFIIEEPDRLWVEEDEMAIYSGEGLPGKQVSVLIGGVPVNNTIVSSNGTWELGIPGSRIKGDSSIPQFSYGGQTTEVSSINKGEPEAESSNLLLLSGIGIIVLIALVSLAFFTGIIGLEIEEDDSETKRPAEFSDDHGEKRPDFNQNLQKFEDHPGWLWDPSNEEWVPDPNFQD